MSNPISALGIVAAACLVACESDVSLVSGPEFPDAFRSAGAHTIPPFSSCEEGCLLPGMTEIHRGEMAVTEQTGGFTLIHALLDFQPGTWFPAHGHGGPTLYTLVEGSVTVHEGSSETEYGPGESYRHDPGQVLAAENPRADPSIMAVAFVLPDGEDMIHFQGEADPDLPAPGTLHSLAIGPIAEVSFSVVQRVIDVEPGTRTPVHPIAGPSLVTVLDGEITVRLPGEESRIVSSGEGWTTPAGQLSILGNPSESKARLVGTYLLPDRENPTRNRRGHRRP